MDAAIREVLEETGIHTQFEALACFRHWHGYRYGKSDIYFVARLSPLSREITMQEEEIEECLWMPVEEYLGSEATSPFNRRIVQSGPGPPRHQTRKPPGLRRPGAGILHAAVALAFLGPVVKLNRHSGLEPESRLLESNDDLLPDNHRFRRKPE